MRLLLRSLFWTIACPGTVTVLLPGLVFINDGWYKEVWAWRQWIGLAWILLGAFVLLPCIIAFAREGKGTLSPADPATQLVVKGLYR